MARSHPAERRDAKPRIRRTEKTFSEMVETYAARSGGKSGTMYSSRKRKKVESLMCSPSILVWPERQKTPPTATRAKSETKLSGTASARATARSVKDFMNMVGAPMAPVQQNEAGLVQPSKHQRCVS